MIRLAKLLLLLACLLLGTASHAQSTATGTRYFGKNLSTLSDFTTADNTADAACKRSSDTYNASATNGYSSTYSVTLPLTCVIQYKQNGVNTSTYSYTISSNTGSISLPCPPAGETRFVNFTLGFTDDPQLSKSATVNTYADKFEALLASGSTCVSGSGSACAVTLAVDAASLGKSWISAAPTSQGLYRVSQDYKVSYTGASCTQSADQKMLTESTDTAPACNGVYGTVNGRGVCVPSSTASRNVLAPVGSSPRYVGNPTAGSNAGLPLSSRTPSAGTGANDGGPVSPVDGSPAPLGSALPTTPSSGSSGSGLQPSDIPAACGAPGQPACKIDETGTPDVTAAAGATSRDPLNAAWDSATESLSTVTSAAGKDTSWGVVPSWISPGDCQPWHIFTLPPPMNSAVDVDLCPVKPYADGVSNFIWVAFTFFGLTSLVFSTMTSRGS